jgi:hypothetical protein
MERGIQCSEDLTMIKTDVLIRLAGFLGAFGLLAIWEICAPRRALTNSKARRWVANLGIVVIDALLIRILFATGAVWAVLVAAQHAWGAPQSVEWAGLAGDRHGRDRAGSRALLAACPLSCRPDPLASPYDASRRS